MSKEPSADQIKRNIQSMKAKKKQTSQIGGKGTQRRHAKHVSKQNTQQDKKTKQVIKKYQAQPLLGIDEVNMFTDDKTVLHFQKPQVFASAPNNVFVVQGEHNTKNIRQMFPQILDHLGPKQMQDLKEIIKEGGNKTEQQAPQLVSQVVNDNFQQVSKVE